MLSREGLVRRGGSGGRQDEEGESGVAVLVCLECRERRRKRRGMNRRLILRGRDTGRRMKGKGGGGGEGGRHGQSSIRVFE